MLKTRDTGNTSLVDVQIDELASQDIIQLQEAKDWARIDGNAEDAIVQDVLLEVVELAEQEMNVLLVQRDVTVKYDSYGKEVKLPYGPFVEMVESSEEPESQKGRYLYFDKEGDELEVTYTAGYDNVPNGIKRALKQWFLTEMEDRQNNVDGAVGEVPTNIRKKLLKYKLY